MNEERCSEEVWDGHFHWQCRNRAKVGWNGRWYCGIHDPVRLEEKRKKLEEKWGKERNEKQEKWRRDKAATAVCEGASTEELEQLGAGWLRRRLDAMKEGK